LRKDARWCTDALADGVDSFIMKAATSTISLMAKKHRAGLFLIFSGSQRKSTAHRSRR